MPKVIEAMKRREEDLLETISNLSNRTKGFTSPKLILIGGYALRAFIGFSRFTRDCDFMMRKKNGWNLNWLKADLPESYSVEDEERHENYGFMRWVKLLQQNKVRIKVSIDFMEGEIRGRATEEAILIDKQMIDDSKVVSIPIAGESIALSVPSYLDYFIMKVVSSRPSDIRDTASLIHENGVPSGLTDRVNQILPYPRIFKAKIEQRLIPEIRKATFLNSWKGIFATTSYHEQDKEKVINQLEKLCHLELV